MLLVSKSLINLNLKLGITYDELSVCCYRSLM